MRPSQLEDLKAAVPAEFFARGPDGWSPDAPPSPPDLANPGPYILIAHVKWREGRLLNLNDLLPCEFMWRDVAVAPRLIVWLPSMVVGAYRSGDRIVAEVCVVKTRLGPQYVASRIQLPNGISGEVFDPHETCPNNLPEVPDEPAGIDPK